LYVVFGEGLVGMLTTVSSPSTLGSPSEVCRDPVVIVVEPVTPLSVAVHVLSTFVAVNTSVCDVFTVSMLVELVTDPVGPGDPCVVTVIGPDVKNVAGPYFTEPVVADDVIRAEPPGGSVTVGIGPISGCGVAKMIMLSAWYPKALPFTAVTSADEGPMDVTSAAAARTTAPIAMGKRRANRSGARRTGMCSSLGGGRI
jgi:hypothetical protein